MGVLRLYYFCFFGALGLQVPYFSPFLKSLGLDPTQVALVMSLIPLLKIFTPAFTGPVADKLGERKILLLFLIPICVVGFVLIAKVPIWIGIWGGMILFSIGRSAMIPLLDSLTMDALRPINKSFSHIRWFGSAGFLCFAVAAGFVFSSFQTKDEFPQALYFWIFMGLQLLVWGIAFFLPRLPYEPSKEFVKDLGVLLSNRKLKRLYLSLAFYGVGWSAFHIFFPLLVEKKGGDPFFLSLNYLVAVGTEMVFLAFAPKLIRRFGPAKLVGPAMCVGALRWVLTGLASDLGTIMALQALHGIAFGIFYVATVELVAQNSPGNVRTSAQSLISLSHFGVGEFVGSVLLAGLARAGYGEEILFTVAGGFALVGAILAFGLDKKPGLKDRLGSEKFSLEN